MEATRIMALKFKLKTKDEIPAELVNLYVERDGAWLLDVDGAVEKAKLAIHPRHSAFMQSLGVRPAWSPPAFGRCCHCLAGKSATDWPRTI
jgi:hypothetical protein